MSKRRSKNNDTHFKVIPRPISEAGKRKQKVISKILQITKERNKLIQERLKLLEETRELRSRLINISIEVFNYDELINENLMEMEA